VTTEERTRTSIKVTVTFPGFSRKPPFQGEFPETAMVGEVRKAAMQYFDVHEDPNSVFYLTFERQRQADDVVLGKLVGPAHAAEFRLAKDTIQG
jgi:hypothetical protein